MFISLEIRLEKGGKARSRANKTCENGLSSGDIKDKRCSIYYEIHLRLIRGTTQSNKKNEDKILM